MACLLPARPRGIAASAASTERNDGWAIARRRTSAPRSRAARGGEPPRYDTAPQGRMTRIGFAYNQKPDPQAVAAADAGSEPRPEDEPPSSSFGAPEPLAATPLPTSDEYAEWDGPETIAAVEQALLGLGEVIRLEA